MKHHHYQIDLIPLILLLDKHKDSGSPSQLRHVIQLVTRLKSLPLVELPGRGPLDLGVSRRGHS